MSATEELLDQGLEHHQAGRPAEAERLYREVLRANPMHADALHLLGLVHHQRGEHETAIDHIRRALTVRPASDVIWANLGTVYYALGRNREAADAAREAVRLNADRAKGHFVLGCALKALGDLDGAAASFRRAIELDPNSGQAHNNLGATLREQGKLVEAANSFQYVLNTQPDSAAAHSNLAAVLHEQGKGDEAAQSAQKALGIDPRHAAAHNNLGVGLREQEKPADAVASFQKALAVNPNYADAHMNLGITLLQRGDFEAGWRHYEWRWQTRGKTFQPRTFSQPAWDGGPLEGRSLLVYAEQGLGDTLQFVRYAPLLQRRGGRVIFECQKPLWPLLTSCPGIDHLVAKGEALPPFDCHVPLLSVPGLLGTHAGNIPADVPYLSARPDLVRSWRDRLADCAGLKVGICWKGSAAYAGDRQRSVALAELAALAAVPGVSLISLQKGPGEEQLADAGFPVRSLGPDFDEANGAFMDTAAVVKNLDLVIAADTAVAHLAGALAAPVWVFLARVPDWRWMLDREDSPWYPTARLFRQDQAGEWGPVVRRLAAALRERLAAAGPALGAAPAGLCVEVSAGELIDKITILQIKSEQIADPAKLVNVRRELAVLTAVRDQEVSSSADLAGLADELRQVNEALWHVEDEIRECERRQDFGPRFIELARSVYRHNDRRSALKRRINDLLGSRLTEEKSYRA
jgi:Flp pilus assembly protein TadD